jgi:small subunit ribosomal protein S13
MAEPKQEKKQEKPKAEKAKEAEKSEKKHRPETEFHDTLVRIFGYDIPGSKNLFSGLTRIKGISWAISNAICLNLNFPKSKKISELSKDEIAKIESFLTNTKVPDFMKNRRFDPETGKTSHLIGSDLDVSRDFDIKRMRKMKSYKGIRHAARLPVRGQRTRSHFRMKKSAGTGIKRKAPSASAAPAAGAKK